MIQPAIIHTDGFETITRNYLLQRLWIGGGKSYLKQWIQKNFPHSFDAINPAFANLFKYNIVFSWIGVLSVPILSSWTVRKDSECVFLVIVSCSTKNFDFTCLPINLCRETVLLKAVQPRQRQLTWLPCLLYCVAEYCQILWGWSCWDCKDRAVWSPNTAFPGCL